MGAGRGGWQPAGARDRVVDRHGDAGAEGVGAERDRDVVGNAEVADAHDHPLGKKRGERRGAGHGSGARPVKDAVGEKWKNEKIIFINLLCSGSGPLGKMMHHLCLDRESRIPCCFYALWAGYQAGEWLAPVISFNLLLAYK